jgi:hypothetical protein
MPRFDLFRIDEGGPLWFGTVETMPEANAKAAQLIDCTECLVRDSVTGEKTVLKTGKTAN